LVQLFHKAAQAHAGAREGRGRHTEDLPKPGTHPLILTSARAHRERFLFFLMAGYARKGPQQAFPAVGTMLGKIFYNYFLIY